MQKSTIVLYLQSKKHASSCLLSKTKKGYPQYDFPCTRTRLIQLANHPLSTSPIFLFDALHPQRGGKYPKGVFTSPKGDALRAKVEALVESSRRAPRLERGGFSVAPSKTELATGHFKYNQFLNFQLSTFFKTYKIEKQINNYKEFKNQIQIYSKILPKIQGAKESAIYSLNPRIRGFETTTSKLKALWVLPRKEGLKRALYKGGLKKMSLLAQNISQKEAYNSDCQIDQGEKNQTYLFLQILLSKVFEGATSTSVEVATSTLVERPLTLYRRAPKLEGAMHPPTPFTSPKGDALLSTSVEAVGGSKGGLETTEKFQLPLAIYGRNPSIYTWPSFFSSAAKDIGIWASLKSKGKPKQNKLFLLNKLTNKTFLSYWLLPIAGFAFFTNYKLIYKPQGLYLSTPLTGLDALGSRNFKTNNEINQTFYKFVNYIKNKKSSNSPLLSPVATPFNGRSEGVERLLPSLASTSPKGDALLSTVVEAKVESSASNKKIGDVDGWRKGRLNASPPWFRAGVYKEYSTSVSAVLKKTKKDYAPYRGFLPYYEDPPIEHLVYPPTLHKGELTKEYLSFIEYVKTNNNKVALNILKSLLYLSRINPLSTNQFLKNNINFITNKNFLKVLKIKRQKNVVQSTKPLHDAKTHVHNYQNGLTLINSNFKNIKNSSSFHPHPLKGTHYFPLQWKPRWKPLWKKVKGAMRPLTPSTFEINSGSKGGLETTSKINMQPSMAKAPIIKNNLGFYTIDKSKKSCDKNNIILNQIRTLLLDNVGIQKKNYMNFIGVEKQVITLKLNLLKTLILPNLVSGIPLNNVVINCKDAFLNPSLRGVGTMEYEVQSRYYKGAFYPLKGISVQRQNYLFSTQSIGQQDINQYFTYLKNILNIFIYLHNQQNFNSFCFAPIPKASGCEGALHPSKVGLVNPQGLGMGTYYAATPVKKVSLRLKNKMHFVPSKFLHKLKNNTNQNIISVSLLFKHYKMFKNKKGADKLAGWSITPLGVINKKSIQKSFLPPVKGGVGGFPPRWKVVQSTESLPGTEGLVGWLTKKQKLTPSLYLPREIEQKKSRLQFQKKRKAKKQRLETRRQKKRTRFFPRPIWLRNRLFLIFLNHRKVKNQKEGAFLNKTPSTVATPFNGGSGGLKRLLPPTVDGSKGGLELRTKYEVPTLNKRAPKLGISKGQASMFTPKSIGYFKKNQINLRDLKLKGNFVNFKNQKTNNSPNNDFDNDKDKDTLFRDFWIWFYNNLTFQLGNPSAFSTPIGSVYRQESTSFGLLSSPSTSPKAGLNVDGNLRAFLSQFGGRQPRSPSIPGRGLSTGIRIAPSFYPKDPLIEWGKYSVDTKIKQIKNSFEIARIYWALNKTNTNTITEFNKRYILWTTQKLRNQSKNNKTKYLEKQFITNWEKFFLNKNLNLFKKKIQSKYAQKKQKLNYLTSYIPHNKKEVFKINNIQNFNISWWSAALAFKPFTVSSDFINISNYGGFLEAWVKINKNAFNLSSYYTDNFLIGISFLLHLCAIITFISISQVRCFIKFHLILLHKLSNSYFSLIQQLSTRLKRVPSIATRANTNIKVYNWSPLYNTSSLSSPLGGNNSSVLKNSPVRTEPLPGIGGLHPLKGTHYVPDWSSTKKQTKMYTFFSLNLLKKHSSLAKNNLSTRCLSKGNYLQVPTKKHESGFKGVKINQSKTIYSKINIISLKSLLIKPQNLSYINKGFANPLQPSIGGFHPLKGTHYVPGWSSSKKQNKLEGSFLNKTPFTFERNGGSKKGLESWSQANFKIKTKQLTNSLFTSSKKIFFGFIMNVIDLFQLSVRNVSSFFEKPAEFTTTWIAYGFLVEWSSDLITIIPENIDIYIWNVFSKVSRNMPLFTYCFLPNGQVEVGRSLVGYSSAVPQSPTWDFSTPLGLAPFEGYSLGLGHKINIATLLPLTYLLHRRMFYLFDTFLFTLSQPDADLIARQEKGTLFWDIWADFLVTAADFYNVNVAALSTIKAEQNALIENISTAFPSSITQVSKRKKDNNKTTALFFTQQADFHGVRRFFSRGLINQATLRSQVGGIHPRWKQSGGSSKGYVGQQTVPYFVLRSHPYSGLGVKNRSGTFLGRSSTSQKNGNLFKHNSFSTTIQDLESVDRWAINQFITYQSWHSHNGSNNSNGDLFIDYHPPKSFTHIPAIKSNSILQQPIGTLVCQIYSGIFNKQISKNILLVFTKTKKEQNFTNYNGLLIQALAGETELKIITDSAQRYAVVNRGFAIGIKLLRDVFDAIALNTPCIFLLEDIHFIGERRPMLISDYGSGMSDDNGSFKEDFFGSQRDEVHEKNQVVYQLTRHAITHYKKPFKGDYSLSIPTNLYVTDLFLKFPTQSTSNLSIIENHNITIKNKIKITPDQVLKRGLSDIKSGVDLKQAKTPSFLRIKQTIKKIAPPNTSPFSVFLLKEEKKLKPNKIVSELPWTGLPTEQLATKPRTSYSIRAKVAMLAELSLSNLSAKLDMITDLLVIIDSVRSNKGFVVFATTNVPHLLDPALRRPGRLDETICLPNISNSTELIFNTNIEIIKSIQRFPSVTRICQLASRKGDVHCTKESNWSFSHPPTVQGAMRSDKEGLALRAPLPPVKGGLEAVSKGGVISYSLGKKQNTILTVNLKDYSIILGMAMKQTTMGLHIPKYSENFSLNYALISHSKKLKHKKQKLHPHPLKGTHSVPLSTHAFPPRWKLKNRASCQPGGQQSMKGMPSSFLAGPTQKKLKAIAYYEVGKVLLNYYLTNNLLYGTIVESNYGGSLPPLKGGLDQRLKPQGDFLNLKSINFLSLYGSKNKIIYRLMSLFSGKISQLLSVKTKSSQGRLAQKQTANEKGGGPLGPSPSPNKRGMAKGIHKLGQDLDFDMSQIFEHNENFQLATTLMLSFIHKRYLYRKNLIVPKLLSFTDGNVLEEPPCPPFSSLLIPAKRFENYKRVFHDLLVGDKIGQRKTQISFMDKLQSHIKSYYIKQLNNINTLAQEPLIPPEGSNNTSPFIGDENSASAYGGKKPPLHSPLASTKVESSASNKKIGDVDGVGGGVAPSKYGALLAYGDLVSEQIPTNINWYYQNRILKRHGQYLTNQWWNGHLSEHNSETVFLSDIDWRSSFIKNKQINLKIKKLYQLTSSNPLLEGSVSDTPFTVSARGINSKGQSQNIDGLDVLLDFPDTDQFYNPRRRRWLLNRNYWNFWFNFDKVYSEKIISTWILESIIKTYNYLHNNTELLDFVTNKFLCLGYPNLEYLDKNSSLSLNNNLEAYSKTQIYSVKEIILTNSFKRF